MHFYLITLLLQNILQMLNTQLTSESRVLIFKLLHHPSDNIKKATLQLVQHRNITGAEDELKQLADLHPNRRSCRVSNALANAP